MAETPKGGSGRNAVDLSFDGGRVEPGGPERAGGQDSPMIVEGNRKKGR